MAEVISDGKPLFELLQNCKMGEAGAIVGGHIDRNQLRKELYVPTEEDEIVTDFFVDGYQEDGRLLVITGSAGDGKSALLSRAFRIAQDKKGGAISEDRIHMDATASTRKTETYDKTLKRFLDQISEDAKEGKGPRSGLAINLGLAIDFFERRGYADEFQELWDVLEDAKSKKQVSSENIDVLNLAHRSIYNTEPSAFGEGLLRDIVDKFDVLNPKSPFHDAFELERKACPAGDDCPLQYNVSQFSESTVRETVTKLLAAKSIIDNSYLNPRRILDHIASMLLPDTLEEVGADHDVCPIGKSVRYGRSVDPDRLLWNTVFHEVDHSSENRVGVLDPVGQSSETTDLKILSWGANQDELTTELEGVPHIEEGTIEDKIRTNLRKKYLTGEGFDGLRTAIEWTWFDHFLRAYSFLNLSEVDGSNGEHAALQRGAQAVHSTLQDSLKGWSGDVVEGDYIEFVDGIKTPDYRFLAKWVSPHIDQEASRERSRQEPTPGQIWFVLRPQGAERAVPVPLTFELYVLMNRIGRGYSPNARDLEQSEGIRLIHSRLSEFTDKHEGVRVMDKVGSELLRLEREPFGEIDISSGRR